MKLSEATIGKRIIWTLKTGTKLSGVITEPPLTQNGCCEIQLDEDGEPWIVCLSWIEEEK